MNPDREWIEGQGFTTKLMLRIGGGYRAMAEAKGPGGLFAFSAIAETYDEAWSALRAKVEVVR